MSEAAITIRQLRVRLGDFVALDGVSLNVADGSFVTIIGPNGAGKTTLLKTLLGLIPFEQGEVNLFGRPLQDVDARWIGYVPQVKTLDREFPALPVELVGTGLRRSWPGRLRPAEREEVMRALEHAGAAHLAARPIGHLSGGELQRVYLARAMVRNPRLILLDEPAGGLDAGGEADMLKILETCQKVRQATIMMITHDWDTARYHASHVLLLDRRAVAFGPPEQALSDELLREAFGHVGHYHEAARREGHRHA